MSCYPSTTQAVPRGRSSPQKRALCARLWQSAQALQSSLHKALLPGLWQVPPDHQGAHPIALRARGVRVWVLEVSMRHQVFFSAEGKLHKQTWSLHVWLNELHKQSWSLHVWLYELHKKSWSLHVWLFDKEAALVLGRYIWCLRQDEECIIAGHKKTRKRDLVIAHVSSLLNHCFLFLSKPRAPSQPFHYFES
jgi:hypothetical protein